jgi:hypothetical protein
MSLITSSVGDRDVSDILRTCGSEFGFLDYLEKHFSKFLQTTLIYMFGENSATTDNLPCVGSRFARVLADCDDKKFIESIS